MEIIKTIDAVGMVLCHDITQILPGEFKGRLYKKGHIITEEDVPKLLNLGKENIYVWDPKKGYVHENEAAHRIAKAVAGANISLTEPSEGKIEFISEIDGLIQIDRSLLDAINGIDDIMMATIHANQRVTKGKLLAGTRIIPLIIREEDLQKMESICTRPILEVVPFQPWKVGLIVTGSEVYHGRIKDGFGPVVEKKLKQLNCEVIEKTYVPDSIDMTSQKILEFRDREVNMIILTGGMSVDPDDLTPASIRAAGAETLIYGVPVLPGAMFMLAYLDGIPVMGLPGGVMYHKASIFDLIVPRLVAGQTVTKQEILQLGYGGFCLKCKSCVYPDCSFGKA